MVSHAVFDARLGDLHNDGGVCAGNRAADAGLVVGRLVGAAGGGYAGGGGVVQRGASAGGQDEEEAPKG
ncbi:MAG: hypothetical protein U0694_20870 [Anaerolineae bacterium]